MPTLRRKGPHIPVAKLAEYCSTASSVRRRAIVRSQLENEFSSAHRWWHTDARTAVRRFLATPQAPRASLREAANGVRDRASHEPDAEHVKELLGSARAIEAFAMVADQARVADVIVVAKRPDDGRIHRAGVAIAVAPDVLFLEKATELVVGALKLHISQTYPLGTEALETAATILYSYLCEHGVRPQRKLCRVVDVFSSTVASAPTAVIRRMDAVEAACEEIEQRWYAMYDQVKEKVERAALRRGARR